MWLVAWHETLSMAWCPTCHLVNAHPSNTAPLTPGSFVCVCVCELGISCCFVLVLFCLVLFGLVQAYCFCPVDLYLLSCGFCSCALCSLFVFVKCLCVRKRVLLGFLFFFVFTYSSAFDWLGCPVVVTEDNIYFWDECDFIVIM